MNNEKKGRKAMNAIDQILDENNVDPIVLYNEKGEEVRFEQIALIPLDQEVFVILRPVELMPGMAEDEALVFAIREEDGEAVLVVEDRDAVIDAVFKVYYEMLEEA